jgi:hypothetical protein
MFESDMKRLEGAATRNEFINHVYDGQNIAETCALMRLNPAAVGIARRDDAEFDKAIRDAQAFRVDMMTDKLENISEYESCPIMAGVVSKNIQWLASKRYRQIYGDKMDVNHNVSINIKAAIEDARARSGVLIEHNPLIDITNATDSTSAAPCPITIAAEEIDPLS